MTRQKRWPKKISVLFPAGTSPKGLPWKSNAEKSYNRVADFIQKSRHYDETKDNRQATLRDILTDLRHYADVAGLEFAQALDGSLAAYREETASPGKGQTIAEQIREQHLGEGSQVSVYAGTIYKGTGIIRKITGIGVVIDTPQGQIKLMVKLLRSPNGQAN